jgi:hypothetical protein
MLIFDPNMEQTAEVTAHNPCGWYNKINVQNTALNSELL